jgi:peptide methionine sulfoxide reductase MsrA
MNGVLRCIVGYSGGVEVNPTYQSMMDYTEAVLVEFNPSMVSYEQILAKWKRLGDPYPSKLQYRSAVWYMNAKQETAAKDFCQGIEYVDVEPVTKFYMAEERHQNFLARL